MNTRTLLFATSLVLAASAKAETWLGSSEVHFKGYSTLHDFEGTMPPVPLKVTVTGEKDQRVVSARSDVAVKRMSTKNDDRDRSMWAMFNVAKFPLIRVNVSGAQEQRLHPAKATAGHMPVTLTIAGTSGTIDATVTNVREAGSNVSFDLAFPVSLKAFKLDPPRAVAGLVKVRDTVEVTAHVTLKKEAP